MQWRLNKPYMYFVSLGMLYCFLSHQIPYGLEDFFITFIKKYFKSYLGISQQLFNRFSAFSVAFWIVDCHLSSVFWAFLIIRSFHLSTVFQPFLTVKWVISLPFLGWFPLFLELFSAIFRDFFKRFFFISRSFFDYVIWIFKKVFFYRFSAVESSPLGVLKEHILDLLGCFFSCQSLPSLPTVIFS